jgi:uridine kinase
LIDNGSTLERLKAENNSPTCLFFVTHNRTEDTITTSRKVMIVEGILILANPELRGFI